MDESAAGATAAGAPDDRRAAALDAAIGVLGRLGDSAARNAVEIRRELKSGQELDVRLIRSVESALLVGIMSPRLRDEGTRVTETKGLLASASGIFHLTSPLPTRQYVRRVYMDFGAAFSRRLSKRERNAVL